MNSTHKIDKVTVYTDGSCHTQNLVGAWASLLFWGNEKILLKGVVQHTTHNRMELMAVINAIDYIKNSFENTSITIYTDSQYVFRIRERMEKLKRKNFLSNKGTPIQNVDLVQALIHQIETNSIEFIKVQAHQRPDGSLNCNNEVDKIVRELMRECVKDNRSNA